MTNYIQQAKQIWWSLVAILWLAAPAYAQKAELVVQTGHYDKINDLAFSPDGLYLASASDDKSVKVWDLTTGKEFRTLRGHKRGVNKVLFSHDSKTLISGGGRLDEQIIFWDWATGKKLHQIKKAHDNAITAMQLSPDGKLLVTGAYRSLKVWEVATKKLLFHQNERGKSFNRLLVQNSVTSIVFHPRKPLMAIGIAKSVGAGMILLWNTRTFEMVKKIDLKDTKSYATALAFSKNGKTLYNTGSLGYVQGRNVKTGKLATNFKSLGKGTPCPCGFSPDLKYVFSACVSEWVVQDLKTGKQVYSLKHNTQVNSSIAFNSSNQTFAVAGENKAEEHQINLYYEGSGKFIRSLQGYPGQVTSVKFSHHNKLLASGNYKRPTRVWELNGGGGFQNYVEGTYTRRGDIVSSVAFSPNDDLLYNGIQGRIYAWQTASGKLHTKVMKGAKERRNIVVSPDGRQILHCASSGAIVWDAKTGKQIKFLGRAKVMTRSVAMSPKGDIYYVGGYKEIRRWNAQTFEELPPLKTEGYAWEMILSPNGKWLATKEGGFSLRDATTGKRIGQLKGDYLAAAAFSRDSKIFAYGNGDDIVLVDTGTLKEIRRLKGHTSAVNTLHFSYDNRLLASGSNDTSIKLWEVKTGKLVATLHALSNDDFIITTPELYYMTTKDGLKGVAFRVGKKVFPFEQFDTQFNRPDIVLKKIGYAHKNVIKSFKRAYQKRLEKLNFNESQFNKDFHLPEVKLLIRHLPVNTQRKQFTLKVKAKDEKYLLDRLHVYINDSPIYGLNGIDLRQAKTKAYEKTLSLELSNGLNKVQVSVMNTKGVESLRQTFSINYGGKLAKPNLHIIALGVGRYKNAKMNLNYARKDAQDVVNTLLLQKDRYAQVLVDTLFDAQATVANVKKLKRKLLKSKVDDRVVVFIAGHGLLDDQLDYYLAMHDVNFKKPSINGLPYGELEGLLDGIPSRNKLLLIDACHSGEIDKPERVAFAKNTASGTVKARGVGNKTKEKPQSTSSDDLDFDVADLKQVGLGNSFDLMKQMFADLRRGSGATVISAAGGMEYALEGRVWNNGVFTYCLLSGLKEKKADLNHDGKVMLSELQQYLKVQVPKITGGKQQPTSRVENLSVDFRVW